MRHVVEFGTIISVHHVDTRLHSFTLEILLPMVGVLFLFAASMSLIINAVERETIAEETPDNMNAAPTGEERH